MSKRTTTPARAGQRAQTGTSPVAYGGQIPDDTYARLDAGFAVVVRLPARPGAAPMAGQGDLLTEWHNAGLLTDADVATITRRTGRGSL